LELLAGVQTVTVEAKYPTAINKSILSADLRDWTFLFCRPEKNLRGIVSRYFSSPFFFHQTTSPGHIRLGRAKVFKIFLEYGTSYS
jgi:hypothetical protein